MQISVHVTLTLDLSPALLSLLQQLAKVDALSADVRKKTEALKGALDESNRPVGG
jgi:hypothetical protein